MRGLPADNMDTWRLEHDGITNISRDAVRNTITLVGAFSSLANGVDFLNKNRETPVYSHVTLLEFLRSMVFPSALELTKGKLIMRLSPRYANTWGAILVSRINVKLHSKSAGHDWI